jgi:ketosteroid isomerase-like protein
MPTTHVSGLVRQYFSAYEKKDRQLIESLLNEDFTFGSPHDPHIDRARYFERCWPNSRNTDAFRIDKLIEDGNDAFVVYECKPKVGTAFSNAEYFRIKGGKVSEVRVFYGWLPTGT